MNHEIETFISKAADQIPKGGVWITLKNIELALQILFDFIYKAIALGIFLFGLYYIYTNMPAILATVSK
jgi:hypothetical protein